MPKTAVGPQGPMIDEPSDLPTCPICDGRMVDIGGDTANHAQVYDPWCPLYGAAMSTDEWRYISSVLTAGCVTLALLKIDDDSTTAAQAAGKE